MLFSQTISHQGTLTKQHFRSASQALAAIPISLGLLSSPALAQTLDGVAIRELALQGTWAAEKDWGYWTWNDDTTLCLRVFGPDGDCADTGTWQINGGVMCYELTWWGEAYDVRKNCYTVHAIDQGRYEARYHGGPLDSVFITFSVLE